MRAKLLVVVGVLGLLGTGRMAQAAIYDFPLAANAYITFGDLDWAWAGPCAAVAPSCGVIDLSFQSAHGWRLPSVAEFALRPDPSDFLFAGANVPQGGFDPVSLSRWGFGNDTPVNVGSDGACAAAYFGTTRRHCDYNDALGGFIWDPGSSGNNPASETWVVRDSADPVPEPASLFLLGSGLLGLTRLRRRS